VNGLTSTAASLTSGFGAGVLLRLYGGVSLTLGECGMKRERQIGSIKIVSCTECLNKCTKLWASSEALLDMHQGVTLHKTVSRISP
jgi:hypothetical protein